MAPSVANDRARVAHAIAAAGGFLASGSLRGRQREAMAGELRLPNKVRFISPVAVGKRIRATGHDYER
jgi:acyl dehydratase